MVDRESSPFPTATHETEPTIRSSVTVALSVVTDTAEKDETVAVLRKASCAVRDCVVTLPRNASCAVRACVVTVVPVTNVVKAALEID
jgi:hypothetical protein